MVRLNEQTISRRFPYPIAAAWHRVALADDDLEKAQRLIECSEILLRTLVAFLLPDYLRGPRAEVVENAIRDMARTPTGGKWVKLVRSLILHLGQRGEPQPFIPEASSWYFGQDRELTDAAKALDEAVRLRNILIHKSLTPAERRKNLLDLHIALRLTLLSMRWLVTYRLFRVYKVNPVRGGMITGSVQLLGGFEERPAPVAAEWDVHLDRDSIHLSNPAAMELLDVRPFIDILKDPATEQPRLYLVKEMADLKKLTCAHDESGTELPNILRDREGEISFEVWLNRRESYDFFRPLQNSIEVLRTPVQETLTEADVGRRWEMLDVLGEGGMATVYRVYDRIWHEEAALKVMNEDEFEDATSRQRFMREAREMHRIGHPNIIHVSDIGELDDGRPFLKMPVMEKGSLAEQITPKIGRPEEDVRRWAENALNALECIHARRIVHRDIKPSNFLLNDDGEAMLTDFGIALTPNDTRITRTLDSIGTVQYMAPEQVKQRTVTVKADIYSLAIVLHELLKGELPEDEPGAGVSGRLGELIRWMGQRDPTRRPSAAEGLAFLNTVPMPLTPPALAPPPKPPRKPRPSTSSRRCREEQERKRHEEEERVSRETEQRLLHERAEQERQQRDEEERRSLDERRRAVARETAERLERERRTAAWKVRGLGFGILIALFAFNYLETSIETILRESPAHVGVESERLLGEAAIHWEPEFGFDQYSSDDWMTIRGYSIAYFFAFPLLALAAILVFSLRRNPTPLLLLAIAAAIDYAVALPFYIIFPVPERWAFNESGAVLLSDLWQSSLIDTFRPFSGLNNCFPSFHVSITVIVVLCFYKMRVPFRAVTVPIGLAIILATFALGIHWLSDIVAGFSAGIASMIWAGKVLRRYRSVPTLSLLAGSA